MGQIMHYKLLYGAQSLLWAHVLSILKLRVFKKLVILLNSCSGWANRSIYLIFFNGYCHQAPVNISLGLIDFYSGLWKLNSGWSRVPMTLSEVQYDSVQKWWQTVGCRRKVKCSIRVTCPKRGNITKIPVESMKYTFWTIPNLTCKMAGWGVEFLILNYPFSPSICNILIILLVDNYH